MIKKINSCLYLSICNITNSSNSKRFKDSLSLLLLFGLLFFSNHSVASANSTSGLKLSSERNSHSVVNRGGVVASGYQIILNGNKFSGAWLQRQGNKKSTIT